MTNISEEVTLKYKYLSSIFAKAFGNDCAHKMAGAVLPLETIPQLDQFMCEILDPTKKEHQRLYEDIRAIKFGYDLPRASEDEQEHIRQVIEDKERETSFRLGGWGDEIAASSADVEQKKKKSKKATKIHLSELHKGYLKQGRVPCECQATEHKLINNCIECGRVVCEQEGSGPCFFCDSMVCTPEEQEILNSNTKQSNQLYNALVERKKSDDWKKMIDRRDKLISYDEQFSSRTKVIDEDEDYFDVNNRWLNEKQRKKIKEHNEKEKERSEQANSKLNKPIKMTFDIEHRRAIEEKENFVFRTLNFEDFEESDNEEYDATGDKMPKMPDISAIIEAMKLKCEIPREKGVLNGKKTSVPPVHKKREKIHKTESKDDLKDLENVDISKLDPTNPDDFIVLQRLEKAKNMEASESEESEGEQESIDDDEYGPDEMPTINDPMYTSALDFGQCLSLHQPWASLLVYGIKKHEGRGWPTDHRGRLWIASTSKVPDKQDIENCEKFYRKYYEDTTVVFPKVYPTGMLLGSVFLQDCVDKEDYEKYYSERELESSPFVFICETPEVLPFPLPIKGKPKIYTLNLDLHKTARKALGLRKNEVKW